MYGSPDDDIFEAIFSSVNIVFKLNHWNKVDHLGLGGGPQVGGGHMNIWRVNQTPVSSTQRDGESSLEYPYKKNL